MSALPLFLSLLAVPGAGPDGADLARQAHTVLKAHCYRCHGQDGTVEGGLNFVLDFKALVGRKKVVPGDAAKSKLYKRLVDADNPMPPEDEKVRPTKEEIALVKAWVDAGAPGLPEAAPRRELIADADVLRLIRDDLLDLPEGSRRHARYFTLTNLYNAGLPEDQLQTYRLGLAKLVNSLSWEPAIVVPRRIDPTGTVLRIDVRDLKWDGAVWQRVLDQYPYGIVPPTPLARAVRALTACDLPHVRADWFVFAASRPPLYHDVLGIPKTDRELEKLLRLDVAENIAGGRAARAGFNGSGVSRNNRIIERHKTAYGAYWKSYDFAGNAGRQNLFANPLGPGDEDNTFRHDGGEIIFHLPNGLQGYMLTDGKGNRIDEGPTKIVSVKNKPDPTVINGVSCMMCHARGMIDKGDQVRGHVEKNRDAFTADDLRAVRTLYPAEADFKALLKIDAERFRKAAEAAGVKLGETEPVAALADRFQSELDLALAAGEAGRTPEAFLRGLERAPDLARDLGPLKVAGATVQRQVFVAAFEDLVRSFGLGAPLGALNRSLAEHTEAIRRVPRDARAHAERADLYYDKGDLDAAINDYGEAIRLGLREADAYRGRGLAYAGKGESAKAVIDYDEALRLEPGHAETLHNRGLAHASKGDMKKAWNDLGAAARLQPRDPEVQADLGLMRLRGGDLSGALASLDEALRLRPRFPEALERRGDARRLAGEWDKALEDYGAAGAYRKRGLARARLGAWKEAVADLKEALRRDRHDAQVHADLAWLLATSPPAEVRDGKEALIHAERACTLSEGKEAEPLQALAAALAECGRFAEAGQRMRDALRLAPEEKKDEYRKRLSLFQAGKPYREAR